MRNFIVLFIILGLPVLYLIFSYNGFIVRRNAMRNAFSSIDVQLRRRWDLVPNLVETVKAFARHEKEVFTQLVAARNSAQNLPADDQKRATQESAISHGIERLLAVAEDYPELTSSTHFLNLQRNLTEIESQISASRRAYNAAVTAWNNSVEGFPGNLLAGWWGFQSAAWFEVQNNERANSKIDV